MNIDRTVHIVDDDDIARKSLAFLLRFEGYRVQQWSSGTLFLKQLRPQSTGCVLLDIRMPGEDGLQVQASLRSRGIAMPVIVMTGHGNVAVAVQAMKAGAMDFLEKPFEREALLGLLDDAFHQIENADRESRNRESARQQLRVLTNREREVLTGLARGFPNKTIAYDLGISPRTVEVHRANLMTKLHVHTFPEALKIAFAAGVDSDDAPCAANMPVDAANNAAAATHSIAQTK